MTHVCCLACRLRFAPGTAPLEACPVCGKPPGSVPTAEATIGFRLFIPADRPHELPEALAAALDPDREWVSSWPRDSG